MENNQSLPACELVRQTKEKILLNVLCSLKGIVKKTANRLKNLANMAYAVVSESSLETEQVQYYAQRLIN